MACAQRFRKTKKGYLTYAQALTETQASEAELTMALKDRRILLINGSPSFQSRQCPRPEVVDLVGTLASSWLGVPLKTPTETIGVLVVQNYEREGVYSQRDVDFLSSVGGQIALAIERKRTEEALTKSEAKFKELFDHAPVGYHELDKEGRIIRVNLTEQDR